MVDLAALRPKPPRGDPFLEQLNIPHANADDGLPSNRKTNRPDLIQLDLEKKSNLS